MKKSKLNRISWGTANILLACYITAELLFEHTTVSRLFLALFCMSIIWILIQNRRHYLELFFSVTGD